MKRFRTAAAAAGVLAAVCTTLVVAAPASSKAAPARAARAAAGLPSCYPGREFTVRQEFGGFQTASSGNASNSSSSVSWNLAGNVLGNLGPGAGFAKTPGSMNGKLTAGFKLPGVHFPVNFTADCIQFAQGGPGECGPSVDVAYEGTVDHRPWSTGDNEAWVLMSVSSDCVSDAVPAVDGQPVTSLHVTIGHPNACVLLPGAEFNYSLDYRAPQSGSPAAAAVDKLAGSLAFVPADDGSSEFNGRGRVALPDGFKPKQNACVGLDFTKL